jgi:hypothetical protein
VPTLIVEIHVPLDPAAGDYRWIDDIQENMAHLGAGEGEEYDDGEEYGDVYVFFLAGAEEDVLLRSAARLARLDGVPPGAVAVVTDDAAPEFGVGRRVPLR